MVSRYAHFYVHLTRFCGTSVAERKIFLAIFEIQSSTLEVEASVNICFSQHLFCEELIISFFGLHPYFSNSAGLVRGIVDKYSCN